MTVLDFSTKTALVTGAARGIGREIATQLVRNGIDIVYALDINVEGLETLRAEFPEHVDAVVVDLRDWNATRAVLTELPPIPLIVNNAMICQAIKPFLDVTLSDITPCYDVNVKATINVTQIMASKMIAHNILGSIVNMASINGVDISFPPWAYYGATKAAINSLTRNFAVHLADHKIRVNSVKPGCVATPGHHNLAQTEHLELFEHWMQQFWRVAPVKREIDPKEIANTVMFLLSEKSLMVNGANVRADLGGCC